MSNLIYRPAYLHSSEKRELLDYLESLSPIWEMRFSKSNPPPEGSANRGLLRPVYWLGNWQFACLNYYHPPKGIDFRCVEAEPYPHFLAAIVDRIEMLTRNEMPERDIPRGWHLNTCLVNYYGARLVGRKNQDSADGAFDAGEGAGSEKWDDVARVGEHKDFEPGPVASLSFGEKALFQFVSSAGKEHQSRVIRQMWLEDNSLQIFGGDQFKKKLFHRVQRVEKKGGFEFARGISDFKTRRINLTFRYVPNEHIQPLKNFPPHLREDIAPYLSELAKNSEFFQEILEP